MQEHMRESITVKFADVCIRVPVTEVDRVKSAFSKFLELAGVQYSIPDDEDLLTWEKLSLNLDREMFSREPETADPACFSRENAEGAGMPPLLSH
jgi:hypothetical protein